MSAASAGGGGPRRARVVVIGAGLTGLATAWHLRDDVEVTLLEASAAPGGQIRTVAFAGAHLDVGADALLARQPEGTALLHDLGFGDDELVAPATGRVGLWISGRLRPLPEHTVMGVPTDLAAVLRSGALTPAAAARAALEPVLPRRHEPGDRSVADLVGERFGRQVVDRLVEPLLGGVYAGQPERLSARATIPPVWAAAQSNRRVSEGLRAHRQRTAGDQRPVFVTVRGGLGRVVDRLAADLGSRLRTSTPVRALVADGPQWRIELADGVLVADQVVLAVPVAVAARLLAQVVPEPARELAGIRRASVGVVALAYDRADAADAPQLSGVLVPRSEGRLVKAVTISSRKWPHHAGHRRFLLRASVGRVDDTSALALDDATLADRVDAEVRWALGLRAPAVERLVVRWPEALAQYDVGHRERVDRIGLALSSDAPSLHVGGAGLDGLGLAARARDALGLARAVRDQAARAGFLVEPYPAGDPDPVPTVAERT